MKITEALAAEHSIFLGVFDQIERALPSLVTATEIRTMAKIVQGMLEGHSKKETELAYAALDHMLEHNGELKRMHQDHHEIDDRLAKVHAAKTCAEARRLLKAALQSSREHFRAEEQRVFPFLERKLDAETLTELGDAWQRRPEAGTRGA